MKNKKNDYGFLSQKELKEMILTELEKEIPDWSLIEKISSYIVDSNVDKVRFSVDAGHIQRLGFELVSKQETALIELIKNAYDADATKVTIDFQNTSEKNGVLIIKDNGSGMRADVIRDTWMNISTDYKKNNTVSEIFGRMRSGRKGIGRFAVQRLGEKLEIATESLGEAQGIRVCFNWDEDFQSGTELKDVFSSLEYFNKEINKAGTELKIINLREAWTVGQLKKVWNGVVLLQPPFQVSKTNQNKKTDKSYTKDPGFEVIINGEVNKQKTEISIQKNFLDNGLAVINASLGKDGNATVSVESKKLHFEDCTTLDNKYPLVGELELEASYFIYLPEYMSSLSIGKAREMGEEYGGIRVYRNGFRVLPYGERSDDWLALDRDSARRTLLMPSSNTNFFGQVYLYDEHNINFEETISREGLLENDAFAELKEFTRKSLEWAALRVAAARNRKQTAGQKGFVSELLPLKKPTEIFSELETSIKNIAISTHDSEESKQKKLEKHIASAKEDARIYEEIVQAEKLNLLEYNEMLRILASLGISIAIFGHEIKGTNAVLQASITLLKKKSTKIDESILREEFSRHIITMESVVDRTLNIGSYIGQIMSHTKSRELETLSLGGAIKDFFEQFSTYLEKQNIQYVLDLPSLNIRTIEMHASELDSVLLNLLTNSVKSIRKAKNKESRIRISIKEDANFAILIFEDNGMGVAEKDKASIFDAFYTTHLEAGQEELEGTGTGLGLKIVKDIATSHGGSIKLIEPSNGYNCCFEFRVLKK